MAPSHIAYTRTDIDAKPSISLARRDLRGGISRPCPGAPVRSVQIRRHADPTYCRRRMLGQDFLRTKFEQGLRYDPYVATGSPAQRQAWALSRSRVRLTDAQRALLASFTRRSPVLVLSGAWCGDCVQQCPILHAIEQAAPHAVEVRFLDRDRHLDLAEQVRICGGLRVPTVIFLDEDFGFVSILGDRTLSRYRAMAARDLGPSCPLPGAALPDDEVAACIQDWVNEFERVQLLLRLSPRLRERHGD